MKKIKSNRGFTLVELLLIMGIASILLGIVTINLLKVQHNTSVSAAVNTLLADLKAQQIKAMSGALATSNGDYGISFESNRYVLFHGTTYDLNDSTNFPVALESSISVSSIFPGDVIVFSQKSGEVKDFSNSTNTITLVNTAGTEQAIITINQYGVVTDIE